MGIVLTKSTSDTTNGGGEDGAVKYEVTSRDGGRTYKFDEIRERFRERISEPDYARGECENCLATLTEADVDADECTNCRSSIESDNEHLYDD